MANYYIFWTRNSFCFQTSFGYRNSEQDVLVTSDLPDWLSDREVARSRDVIDLYQTLPCLGQNWMDNKSFLLEHCLSRMFYEFKLSNTMQIVAVHGPELVKLEVKCMYRLNHYNIGYDQNCTRNILHLKTLKKYINARNLTFMQFSFSY